MWHLVTVKKIASIADWDIIVFDTINNNSFVLNYNNVYESSVLVQSVLVKVHT